MATTTSTIFGTSTALTITLASLATSATRLVGRIATALDISGLSPVPIDLMIGGLITTGTTPTASQLIEIWAAGSEDGTNYSGSVGTTDGSQTLVAETKALLQLVASIATNGTSNTAYEISPRSLFQVFGGQLPRKVTFFVTHSTGVNLNATAGNQFLKYTPINYLNT